MTIFGSMSFRSRCAVPSHDSFTNVSQLRRFLGTLRGHVHVLELRLGQRLDLPAERRSFLLIASLIRSCICLRRCASQLHCLRKLEAALRRAARRRRLARAPARRRRRTPRRPWRCRTMSLHCLHDVLHGVLTIGLPVAMYSRPLVGLMNSRRRVDREAHHVDVERARSSWAAAGSRARRARRGSGECGSRFGSTFTTGPTIANDQSGRIRAISPTIA